MGDKVQLTLQERTVVGKAVKKLRLEGLVPAVVYGNGQAALSVMAPTSEMARVYRAVGQRTPVELNLGAKTQLAMIKKADIDPVKRTVRHLDFLLIKQNEKVSTTVPIVIEGTGETPAEKAGLVVLTTIDSVDVEALPANLPESLTVAGEKLAEVSDHLTIADLQVPSGVTVMSDPEQVIATVYEPSALQAANEAAGGDAEAETNEEPEEGAEGESADGQEPSGEVEKPKE